MAPHGTTVSSCQVMKSKTAIWHHGVCYGDCGVIPERTKQLAEIAVSTANCPNCSAFGTRRPVSFPPKAVKRIQTIAACRPPRLPKKLKRKSEADFDGDYRWTLPSCGNCARNCRKQSRGPANVLIFPDQLRHIAANWSAIWRAQCHGQIPSSASTSALTCPRLERRHSRRRRHRWVQAHTNTESSIRVPG